MKKATITEIDKAKICELYQRGLSQTLLTRRYGCCSQRLKRILQAGGVAMRSGRKVYWG